MSSQREATEESLLTTGASLVLLVLALLPGVVVALPGVLIPLGSLLDTAQSHYLTTANTLWLVGVMVVSVLPLPVAVLTVRWARKRGRSWAAAFLIGAAPAFLLGLAGWDTALLSVF